MFVTFQKVVAKIAAIELATLAGLALPQGGEATAKASLRGSSLPSDPEPFFASRQNELWGNQHAFTKVDAISEQQEWENQTGRTGSTFI